MFAQMVLIRNFEDTYIYIWREKKKRMLISNAKI